MDVELRPASDRRNKTELLYPLWHGEVQRSIRAGSRKLHSVSYQDRPRFEQTRHREARTGCEGSEQVAGEAGSGREGAASPPGARRSTGCKWAWATDPARSGPTRTARQSRSLSGSATPAKRRSSSLTAPSPSGDSTHRDRAASKPVPQHRQFGFREIALNRTFKTVTLAPGREIVLDEVPHDLRAPVESQQRDATISLEWGRSAFKMSEWVVATSTPTRFSANSPPGSAGTRMQTQDYRRPPREK